jgi:hypothetical protein
MADSPKPTSTKCFIVSFSSSIVTHHRVGVAANSVYHAVASHDLSCLLRCMVCVSKFISWKRTIIIVTYCTKYLFFLASFAIAIASVLILSTWHLLHSKTLHALSFIRHIDTVLFLGTQARYNSFNGIGNGQVNTIVSNIKRLHANTNDVRKTASHLPVPILTNDTRRTVPYFAWSLVQKTFGRANLTPSPTLKFNTFPFE